MTDGIRGMFGLGDVMEFASLPARQRYREPIEVESHEYEAWDANRPVLEIGHQGVGEKLARLESTGTVTNCRALLGWTADGGCPHVVSDGFG